MNKNALKNLSHKYWSSHCHHIVSIYHEKDPVPEHSGNLFLSGIAGLKRDVITSYNISQVLTIMDKWTYEYDQVDLRIKQHNLLSHHKWIDLEDTIDSSIYQHFDDTFEYIDMRLKDKNVLVHCHMGISRSASLVLAYLMRKFGVSLDEAYQHTVGIRDTIEPNSTFWKQLQRYEKDLQSRQ